MNSFKYEVGQEVMFKEIDKSPWIAGRIVKRERDLGKELYDVAFKVYHPEHWAYEIPVDRILSMEAWATVVLSS